MTVHTIRLKRKGRGAKSGKQRRIMVALPPEMMAIVTQWAAKKKIPVSAVLRDCVWAYFLPFLNNPTLKP